MKAHGEDRQRGYSTVEQIRARIRLRHPHRAGTGARGHLRRPGPKGQPGAALAWWKNRHLGQEQSHAVLLALWRPRPLDRRAAPEYDQYEEYDDELYESEAALRADDLDTITFCEERAPEAGDLVPLPNSPRVGVNCYDDVHSWGSWPLAEPDEW